MANPHKGEIAFTVEGGDTYTAVFSIDVICAIEDALDKTIAQVAVGIAMGRVGYVRHALWQALSVHHKGLRLTQVGELMIAMTDAKAGDLVQKGIERAFPTAEDRKGEPDSPRPPKAQAEDGTGQPS